MANGTIVKDVISVADLKRFVTTVDITYDDLSHKGYIMNSDLDSFMLVTKRIGSKIAIVDVKLVDDALIDSYL